MCSKTDETRGHDVRWNKPDTERQIPHLLLHRWKLELKQKATQFEHRMLTIGGWRGERDKKGCEQNRGSWCDNECGSLTVTKILT